MESLFVELETASEEDVTIDELEEEKYREDLRKYREIQKQLSVLNKERRVLADKCKAFHAKYNRSSYFDRESMVRAVYYQREKVAFNEKRALSLFPDDVDMEGISEISGLEGLWEELSLATRKEIISLVAKDLDVDNGELLKVNQTLVRQELGLSEEAFEDLFDVVDVQTVFRVDPI